MLKQFTILFIASITLSVVSAVLSGFNPASPEGLGFITGGVLGPVMAAVILASIPAGIYWLFKRKRMPGFMIVIWAIWGIIVLLGILGNFLSRRGSF